MKAVTFIRIPKNASTSLYTLFGDKNTIKNEYIDANNERYLDIFESSHCEIDYAIDRLGERILAFPVVAVTRNPFDRLVSIYSFARKYNLGRLYGIDTSTFDKFAIGFYEHSKESTFFHAFSQSFYMEHPHKESFNVLTFENLQEDLVSFIFKNNLDGTFDAEDLQKLNSTEHTHYREYYSNLSKNIVEDMWEEDFINFHYSF